jgi:hypothetical protein
VRAFCLCDLNESPSLNLAVAHLSQVLIVAGLSRKEWVTGTQVNGTSVDVGLFRECKNENCYNTGTVRPC